MSRLTNDQFVDEFIHRQVQISRYATGQSNIAKAMLWDMAEKISRFCLKKEVIETKGQYTDCRVYIRKQCLYYRERLYKYMEKELRGFIIEQSAWLYQNSPVKLHREKVKKIGRDVFFEAFSDTDNIKSYVTRIFNQIYQLWNSQLSIAYRTGNTMKDMVKTITGKII